MAYNTRKMLEDSNGDLIPQYFNQQSDVYEHLQGAQGVNFVGNHVLTDSGIWVPQRGTEDGAAHTQLTGSIVEEKLLADSLKVAAGANVRIVVSEAEHYINEIAFGVFNETGEGEFRLSLDYRFSSQAPVSGPLKVVNFDGSGYYMGVERHKLIFPQLRVIIVNRSEFEQTFTVYQFGWR